MEMNTMHCRTDDTETDALWPTRLERMGDVNTTTEGNTPVSYTIDLDTVADVWMSCA